MDLDCRRKTHNVTVREWCFFRLGVSTTTSWWPVKEISVVLDRSSEGRRGWLVHCSSGCCSGLDTFLHIWISVGLGGTASSFTSLSPTTHTSMHHTSSRYLSAHILPPVQPEQTPYPAKSQCDPFWTSMRSNQSSISRTQ